MHRLSFARMIRGATTLGVKMNKVVCIITTLFITAALGSILSLSTATAALNGRAIADTNGRVVLTGIDNATGVQSSQFHEIVLSGNYHGAPSIVVFNERKNRVVGFAPTKESNTNNHIFQDLMLDEQAGVVFADYQDSTSQNAMLLDGVTLSTAGYAGASSLSERTKRWVA